MIRRTSLNLDVELVNAAKDVLHTTETTETINRALEDVVRHARLQRLAGRRFEVPPEELEALRRPRTAEAPPVSLKP